MQKNLYNLLMFAMASFLVGYNAFAIFSHDCLSWHDIVRALVAIFFSVIAIYWFNIGLNNYKKYKHDQE